MVLQAQAAKCVAFKSSPSSFAQHTQTSNLSYLSNKLEQKLTLMIAMADMAHQPQLITLGDLLLL
ncbi:MAG: hypothetical protein Q9M19_04810 [Mariprofundaceae bacterium]|nr:hypothetical protein [Mariprofundaceae bacterium]